MSDVTTLRYVRASGAGEPPERSAAVSGARDGVRGSRGCRVPLMMMGAALVSAAIGVAAQPAQLAAAQRPAGPVIVVGCILPSSASSTNGATPFVLANAQQVTEPVPPPPSHKIAIVGGTTAGTTPATNPATTTPPSTTPPTVPPGVMPTPSTPSPSTPVTTPELPAPSAIVGQTGGETASDVRYALSGLRQEELRDFAHQRVEIRGSAGTLKTTRPDRSGRSATQTTRTLQISTIRVLGPCDPTKR